MSIIICFVSMFGGTTNSPSINWSFTKPSCSACWKKQITLMESYFLSGDKITIYCSDGKKQEAQELKNIISEKWPVEKIEVHGQAKRRYYIMTGFVISDSNTGEEFVYNSTKGSYSLIRSKALLRLFRDPRP